MPGLSLFKITASIQGFRGVLFTGKLVKTIVIKALPELSTVFQPSTSETPKLIHVSPLYTAVEGGIKCLYSSVECGKGVAKCDGEPSKVLLNGDYWFYIGFSRRVLRPERLMEAVNEMNGCFTFMDQRVCVTVSEVEYVDPAVASTTVARNALNKGKLKVVFSSPTLLRDPFKRTKHKSLVPTVLNVFSTPVYLMLSDQEAYSLKKYRRQLLILHKLFNESYTALKTVRLKWVKYKQKPEPAITGYINLYLNPDYLQYYGRHINMEKYLGEIMAYMATLGVGVGRATGFGHVFLKA